MLGVVSAENCGIRSCSADTGVDVPVVQVVDWVSTGGASNSVHRQSSWTFQYAQRQGAFSEGTAAMLGWAFFALLRVVPELSASFRSLDDEEFFVVEGSCTISP